MKWGALVLSLVVPSAGWVQPIEPTVLYVWQFPGQASAQISNSPPPWYRFYEPSQGPRVRVYRGRALIDDTGLPVPQRQALAPRSAPKPAAKPNLF